MGSDAMLPSQVRPLKLSAPLGRNAKRLHPRAQARQRQSNTKPGSVLPDDLPGTNHEASLVLAEATFAWASESEEFVTA